MNDISPMIGGNIIWQRPDGTVAIAHVLNGTAGQVYLAQLLERAHAARAAREALPADHEWRHVPTADEDFLSMTAVAFDVPSAELPPDKTNRAAWRWCPDTHRITGG